LVYIDAYFFKKFKLFSSATRRFGKFVHHFYIWYGDVPKERGERGSIPTNRR
jgi:hypothetical protein